MKVHIVCLSPGHYLVLRDEDPVGRIIRYDRRGLREWRITDLQYNATGYSFYYFANAKREAQERWGE